MCVSERERVREEGDESCTGVGVGNGEGLPPLLAQQSTIHNLRKEEIYKKRRKDVGIRDQQMGME